MKRPILLYLLLLSAVCNGADRPNVLFIIVDDLTTTLGCYGDKVARTPNMDALAARGVRFQQAYTQFALCNPSRCSFLTGCYPERTKVYDLSTSLRVALPDVVTLPQAFKNAGYLSGRVGKVFHVPDPKTKLDAELPTPLNLDNIILREAKLAQESEGDLSDPVRTKGRKDATYNKPFGPSEHPDKDFTDFAIADRAISTIETWKDKPFFLAVGFIRPHTPFVAPKAFFNAIDRSKITLPPFFQDGGENMKLMPAAALRPNNNLFTLKQADKKEAVDARHAYEASASWTDSQVGRILAKLKELMKGQLERTRGGLSRQKLKRALLDALAARHTFEVPPGLVNVELETILRQAGVGAGAEGAGVEVVVVGTPCGCCLALAADRAETWA
jgi:uncharacterized sulfatase